MDNEELYLLWRKLYEQAKKNMAQFCYNSGVLIEVAAQHPLINGEYPNEEFEKRLILGAQIYQEEVALGRTAYIYVPGSIHMDNGISDKISLSMAGRNYLLKNGIPGDFILSEDMNEKYKGGDGVYNSTDECYVASKIFKDMNLGRMHCVCSSGQMMRKVLSYIKFGYVPYMHTISCDVMYHDYIDEIFKYIPILISDDNALQGESEEADRLRRLRKPQ